jgi:hypothetical protein
MTNRNNNGSNEHSDDRGDAALPSELLVPLIEAKQRIRNLPAAQRMWDRLLTPAQRDELGGDVVRAYRTYGGTLGIWARLRPGAWEPRAVILIARAAGVLDEATYAWLDRELAAYDPSPQGDDERVALARRTRPLVLVEASGRLLAYWRGAAVDRPWHRNPMAWELLWTLAENARARRDVGWDEVSRAETPRAIVDRRSRLGRLLPHDLNERIVPGESSNRYRLALEPGEIGLFELEDWITELQ